MVEPAPYERGGGDGRSSLSSYTDVFEQVCTYYLECGMPYDLYWNGDACAVRYYRPIKKNRIDEQNMLCLLLGTYFYEALCDASPVFNPMSKKHEPLPYRTEVIPLTKEQAEEQEEARQKKMIEEQIARFHRMMETDKKRKEGKSDG